MMLLMKSPSAPRAGNRRYEQGDLLSLPVEVIDCDCKTGHLRGARLMRNTCPDVDPGSLVVAISVPHLCWCFRASCGLETAIEENPTDRIELL
jgi:hypothetical protein